MGRQTRGTVAGLLKRTAPERCRPCRQAQPICDEPWQAAVPRSCPQAARSACPWHSWQAQAWGGPQANLGQRCLQSEAAARAAGTWPQEVADSCPGAHMVRHRGLSCSMQVCAHWPVMRLPRHARGQTQRHELQHAGLSCTCSGAHAVRHTGRRLCARTDPLYAAGAGESWRASSSAAQQVAQAFMRRLRQQAAAVCGPRRLEHVQRCVRGHQAVRSARLGGRGRRALGWGRLLDGWRGWRGWRRWRAPAQGGLGGLGCRVQGAGCREGNVAVVAEVWGAPALGRCLVCPEAIMPGCTAWQVLPQVQAALLRAPVGRGGHVVRI